MPSPILHYHVDAFFHKGDQTWQLLIQSGQSLQAYYSLMKVHPRRVPTEARQQFMNHCVHHISTFQLAGGMCVPKHHAWTHLTRSIVYAGNPSYYNTYKDESDNGVVKRMAIRCHPHICSTSIFEKILIDEDETYGIQYAVE